MDKQAHIKNKVDELPVDFTIQSEGETDWHTKTLAADSETKLEDDKGEGDVITLRFFQFAVNPEEFAKHQPTAQELMNNHSKQIQIELWKDEWEVIPSIAPRVVFTPDKKFYIIEVTARPAKGSKLSIQNSPQVLKDLVSNVSS